MENPYPLAAVLKNVVSLVSRDKIRSELDRRCYLTFLVIAIVATTQLLNVNRNVT